MIGAITAGLFSTGTAASTNSYESIATVTVGAGGSSSISFSSIPSTYKHLQVRLIGKVTTSGTSDTYAKLSFNSDTTYTNYNGHDLYGDGASVASGYDYSAAYTGLVLQRFPNAGVTSTFGTAVIDILDYTNTNKYKVTRGLGGYDKNGAGFLGFYSGLWRNTAAVTDITITPGQDNWAQYSSFALYGVK